MISELQWLLQKDFHSYLARLSSTVGDCEQLLENSSGKFVLGGNDAKQHGLKAVVSLGGEEVLDAEITLETPAKLIHKFTIGAAGSYTLQQLVNCGTTLRAVKALIEDAQCSGCGASPADTLSRLEEIFRCLKLARDQVMLPQKRTVEDLANSKSREVFQPELPADASLSLYVSGQKLILAVYFLHSSAGGRQHEIAGRQNVHTEVPWLNELLLRLTLAMFEVSQLVEKMQRIRYTMA